MSAIKEITPPSVMSLLAQSLDRVVKAQAEHTRLTAFADSLPAGTPIPKSMHLFGYCSEHTLDFSLASLPGVYPENVLSLLKMYPPVAVVDVNEGGTQSQKPRSHVRESESFGDVVDLYPVILKREKDGKDLRGADKSKRVARWWTELKVGLVCLQVEGLPQDSLWVDKSLYRSDSQTYSTGSMSFYPRRLAPLNFEPTLIEKWDTNWDEFIQAEGISPAAQKFVFLVKAQLLALGKAPRLEDVRAERFIARVGDCNDVFSPALMGRLLELGQEQALAYSLARDAQNRDLEKGKAWVEKFFTNWSSMSESEATTSRVLYVAQKETGINLSFNMLGNQSGNKFRVRVQIPGTFSGYNSDAAFVDLVCQGSSDKPKLVPQAMTVEYASSDF